MPQEQKASSEQKSRGLFIPNLIVWRNYRALTQQELAIKAGVARGTVLRAEGGGSIQQKKARNLAQALGISVEQLLTEQPPSGV